MEIMLENILGDIEGSLLGYGSNITFNTQKNNL
jgi:hypothetical protein